MDRFDVLILKIIFKKKYYFDAFPSEIHFKKQHLSNSKIGTSYAMNRPDIEDFLF